MSGGAFSQNREPNASLRQRETDEDVCRHCDTAKCNVNLSGEYPNEKEHAVAGAEGQYVQGQLEEVDFLSGRARASAGPAAPYLH
jgi:hypothetical protein